MLEVWVPAAFSISPDNILARGDSRQIARRRHPQGFILNEKSASVHWRGNKVRPLHSGLLRK